jgi:hypothetical protein
MHQAPKSSNALDSMAVQFERLKARIRAKVEHSFRVIKRQLGYLKVRYKGLLKNTQQITTSFALGNTRLVLALILQTHQVLSAPGDARTRAANEASKADADTVRRTNGLCHVQVSVSEAHRNQWSQKNWF